MLNGQSSSDDDEGFSQAELNAIKSAQKFLQRSRLQEPYKKVEESKIEYKTDII